MLGVFVFLDHHYFLSVVAHKRNMRMVDCAIFSFVGFAFDVWISWQKYFEAASLFCEGQLHHLGQYTKSREPRHT